VSLFDLTGKVALVTGGTRGIGHGIVEALAAAGAQVAFCSENAGDVARAQGELGPDFLGVHCDVAGDAALARFVAATVERFGGLDIVVGNAGITGRTRTFAALEMDDFGDVMAINLRHMVVLAKLAQPHLKARGGGSIVLMASISALRGNGQISSYALAKAGLAQLARNLAVEWGPDNIRANAVAPGLIRTELSAAMESNAEFMARRMQMTPLKRMGTVAEIAGTTVWLASPAGAFVNGQTIVVDGGTVITDGS
jgi:NAD(P)-dependent dehydrogenase (short-subunit alcohol dehydrogenase family)